jgi:tetratricopeptide (TPR) repeat protein
MITKFKGAILVGLLVLCTLGCSSNTSSDTESVSETVINEEVDTGIDYLKEGEIADAVDAFEEVLSLDPENGTANFVLSITTLADMMVDEGTEDFLNSLEDGLYEELSLTDLEAILDGSSTLSMQSKSNVLLTSIVSSVVEPSVEIASYYEFIDGTFLPFLDDVISHLDIILDKDEFNFILTEQLSGAEESIEIDKGDVYVIASHLHLLAGFVKQRVAYDYSVEGDDYEQYEEFTDLLDENPNFGTLRSQGSAYMLQARDHYVSILT